MPKLKDNEVPSYRLHKQSGQAVVTLNGRDHLLGQHGSSASKKKYRQPPGSVDAILSRARPTAPELAESRLRAGRSQTRVDGTVALAMPHFSRSFALAPSALAMLSSVSS